MRTGHRLLLVVVFEPLLVFGQDWQDCKPDGDFSFNEIKAAVRTVSTSHVYSGSDDKAFSRSGDLVAVAILQTLEDSAMASPEGAKNALVILHAAFGCPQRCVKAKDDRRPRVTLLLLDHLRQLAPREMEKDIAEAQKFILNQTRNLQ